MAFTYQNAVLLQNPMRSLNSPKHFEVLNLNLNLNLDGTVSSLGNLSAALEGAHSHNSRLLTKPSIGSFKDISLIAFLPVCVLACLFLFAFIVVRVRSWRQERTQLRHLEKVYDILECACDAPKPVVRAIVTNAIAVQTDGSTPFFHPVNKFKGSSNDHKTSQAVPLTTVESRATVTVSAQN